MKKFALLLSTILCSVISIFALTPDELAGYWESKWTKMPGLDREVSGKVKSSMTISADSVFSEKDEVQISIIGQPSVDCFMYADYSGTYKIDADSVVLKIDPASIQLDFPEDEIRISGQVDADQEAMIKSTIHYNLHSMLPEMKKSIKGTTLKNVVITADKKKRKFTCEDDGQKIEYVEKKK